MLLVILPGHIDLSVGSGAGLLGGAAAVLIFKHGWPAPAALALVTLVALTLWLAVGTLIVTQRVPSFIVTLGGLLIFRGLHWYVINKRHDPPSSGAARQIFIRC